ncbi:MAG: M23 family metallopeptidase [Gammaproteobacteria bacterium]|nr:M23 family metallopeptidase [Gammaproteobacteria bacterium]MCL5255815.1 M23 family metallopeptidase [Gammaproteobacteria bacterium]
MRKIGLWLITVVAVYVVTNGHVQAAEPELRGQFVQGGMVVGQTDAGNQVTINGQPLKVSADGLFVFGIGRDDVEPIVLAVATKAGKRWRQTFTIGTRKFDIQRVDGLPQQTVTPDPDTQARIAEDNRKIGAARSQVSARTDFNTDWIWPAEGRITGVYGSQRILNGEPRAPHWGLDIANVTGTPVYAPAAGVVRLAEPDLVLSGGTIIVDHGHDIFSSFLHLHAIHVNVGDEIQPGDLIGEIGATGRATGPHLDWRMNWGSVRIDPELLLPPRQ